MIDRGLYNHIQYAIKEGKSKDDISAELARGGWTQTQIDEAYVAVQNKQVPDVDIAAPEAFVHTSKGDPLISLAGLIFFPILLVVLAYGAFDIVPTFDFDVLTSNITAYPAFCHTDNGVVTYSVDSATPVSFLVDRDSQIVTEYVYSNYKGILNKGTPKSSHQLQNCTITDRMDWQCMDNGAQIGFTKSAFFDSAQTDSTVCFVPRATWYRLMYPPAFGF